MLPFFTTHNSSISTAIDYYFAQTELFGQRSQHPQ
jgi:hypothetical protein